MQLKSLENIYHINKKSNVAKWFLFTFLAFVLIEYIKEIDGEFKSSPSTISKIEEICTSLFLFQIF